MSTCTSMVRIVTTPLVAVAFLVPPSAAASAADASEWTPFGQDADAVCADGSGVDYLERAADPSQVVLYLEGGGGCWSAEMCAFDSADQLFISESLATPEWLSQRGGLFDFDDPRNPLADYSWLYVPYCTGDVHLGNTTTVYAPDVVVEHHGYPNGLVAVDYLADTYPDATDVVVAGISAGSVASPLYAGLVADALPDARVVSLGDSSGGYPGIPVLNGYVGTMWGTGNAIPDWPETEDMTVREWSIPGLYGVVAAHAPDVIFGTFDHAFDGAQVFFAQLAGLDADELVTLIDQNDVDIAADGARVAHYVAAGSGHTIIDTDGLYELVTEGEPLIDWIADLVTGEPVEDVHCSDCR